MIRRGNFFDRLCYALLYVTIPSSIAWGWLEAYRDRPLGTLLALLVMVLAIFAKKQWDFNQAFLDNDSIR